MLHHNPHITGSYKPPKNTKQPGWGLWISQTTQPLTWAQKSSLLIESVQNRKKPLIHLGGVYCIYVFWDICRYLQIIYVYIHITYIYKNILSGGETFKYNHQSLKKNGDNFGYWSPSWCVGIGFVYPLFFNAPTGEFLNSPFGPALRDLNLRGLNRPRPRSWSETSPESSKKLMGGTWLSWTNPSEQDAQVKLDHKNPVSLRYFQKIYKPPGRYARMSLLVLSKDP